MVSGRRVSGRCVKYVGKVSNKLLEGVWKVYERYQVKSGRVKSGQVKSGQVNLGQVKSGQIKVRQVR